VVTTPASENDIVKKIPYKTIGDVTLRLHLFEPPEQAEGPRPGIVFFFGGGWVGGRPGQFYPHCECLAKRGMVAMSAEYRVKDRHGTSPRECVQDGRSAVRWVRQHAADLGIDPNRIAAGGGSAGGHVAACTGTLAGYDEPGEDASISARPDAMVLFNPVLDAAKWPGVVAALGDRGEELSPLHNVSPGVPPTLILHARDDVTTPFSAAEEFQAAMDAADNDCVIAAYETGGHGFFNYSNGEQHQPFRDTIIEVDAFLTACGLLKGGPLSGEEWWVCRTDTDNVEEQWA
jgi:acetyl esterase/lipase